MNTKINIFGTADWRRPWINKMVIYIRQNFYLEGGQPVDFPEFLSKQGVHMDGAWMVVSDEFLLMAQLKFG